MEKIKKGDVLVCIDKGRNEQLSNGKEYAAIDNQFHDGFVGIINDANSYARYHVARFRKKEIPQPVFKKGDVLVCIDADQVTLTKGYHYEAASDSTCKDLVRVKCDLGTETNYCVSRFRKADSYNGIPQLTAPLDLIKQIAEANPAFKAEAERIWPDAFPVPVPEIKLEKVDRGFGNSVVIADVNHPVGDGGYWAVALHEGQIELNIAEFDWKIEGVKLIPTRKP